MQTRSYNPHPKTTHLLRLSLLAILCLGFANHSEAQILQGQWVDQSQTAIEQHRKTDVTVIVLDQQDRAVQGATVRLVQQRHDFVLGLTLPTNRMPPKGCRALPVYRCFNAIAMDRYTDWSVSIEATPTQQADRLTAWTQALAPIRKDFGTVISADPARNHDRLSLLTAAELRDAVYARIDLANVFDPQADRFDLYSDALKQDMVERKLGHGMLPRMFDRADAQRPEASFGVRVSNAISLRLGRDFVGKMQAMQVRQVALDHITIEQQFAEPVQPNAMRRMLDEYIGPMNVPVTIAGLEVGGPTPVAAAIKLETLIRLMFAQPKIDGLYFAGLVEGEEELLENHAALIDPNGQPTAAGEVLDSLFTQLWHSDTTDVSDERGNVASRVFTGWYKVVATLPDGTEIVSEAYVPKADRAKRIILQATAAENNE